MEICIDDLEIRVVSNGQLPDHTAEQSGHTAEQSGHTVGPSGQHAEVQENGFLEVASEPWVEHFTNNGRSSPSVPYSLDTG